MRSPTVSTLKKLFAVSGNRCAFPKCPNPLIEEPSGSLVAKVCHIKGKSEGTGSKRYDKNQSDEERHGVKNLILLCPIHHDVIDDDEDSYTVERLLKMKADHEEKCRGTSAGSDALASQFAIAIHDNITNDGSVIQVHGQSGGQTAHTIHNYAPTPQPQSAFVAELAKRHLAETGDPNFARTRYHRKMGLAQKEQVRWLKRTALAFASFPTPVFDPAKGEDFIRWMNCNSLRYEPCRQYPFIPSPAPERVGSAIIWKDDFGYGAFSAEQCYHRYLALEPSGWLEYGFLPTSLLDNGQNIYYSSIVANTVGFLSLLRDIAARIGVEPSKVSLGVGVRDTKGAELGCITEIPQFGPRMMRTTAPQLDNLLYLRPASGEDWEIDEVAQAVAICILEHWEFSRPAVIGTPEFDGSTYRGGFFRERINSWG